MATPETIKKFEDLLDAESLDTNAIFRMFEDLYYTHERAQNALSDIKNTMDEWERGIINDGQMVKYTKKAIHDGAA